MTWTSWSAQLSTGSRRQERSSFFGVAIRRASIWWFWFWFLWGANAAANDSDGRLIASSSPSGAPSLVRGGRGFAGVGAVPIVEEEVEAEKAEAVE